MSHCRLLLSYLLPFAALCFAVPVASVGAEPAPGDPPAESVLAEIPFEVDAPTNRVVLDLAAEGHDPFVLIVDTGASRSVMTPLAARAAGVTVRRTKSSPYRRPTRLGRDLQFLVDTQSSDTGSRTGWEYGLIGADFLADYVVEFDFKGRRVRFMDPKKYRVPESVDRPNEAILPMRLYANRPAIQVDVNGKKFWTLLDTGSPVGFTLGGKSAKKAGIDLASLHPFGVAGTSRGPMPLKLYEDGLVHLGPYLLEGIPMEIAPRGWYNQGTQDDAALGYDVLQQFTIRLDYKRKRLWLRRETTAPTYLSMPYGPLRESGLFAKPNSREHFYVRWVRPGSPAHELGLRAGDFLRRLEGGEPLPLETLVERVVAGETIKITRKTGKEVWTDLMLPDDLEYLAAESQ